MGNAFSKMEKQTKHKQILHSSNKFIQDLESLEKIIFELNEDNINDSINMMINLINNDDNISTYSNLILNRLIYSAIFSRMQDFSIYIEFIKNIEIKEREFFNNNKYLIDSFKEYLFRLETQESYFILEKMIENEMIDQRYFDNISSFCSRYYYTKVRDNQFKDELFNYDELSQEDFEFHKRLIKEGVNPNEILKNIRNDEIEKLQEITSQTNFDFNQMIKPSPYERCSFINEEDVTLIDYAAFFSSVECFKFLLMNGANVKNTGKYAIAGGNEEIIHLCEQNHSSFENAYEAAIIYHRNDIFKYIYENKIVEYPVKKFLEIILSNKFVNFEIFNFYLEKKELILIEKLYIHNISKLFLIFNDLKLILVIIQNI